MTTLPQIPLDPMPDYSGGEMQERAESFLAGIRRRRTIRDFSDRPVPRAILGRPVNERAVMILVAGYPAADATVPLIGKKPLTDIASFF